MTTSPSQDTRDHRVLIGFIAGAVLGAGLGMLLAPRGAVELRGRLAGSAKKLGKTVSGRHKEASARVGAAAKEYASKAQEIRDGLADTVVRSAERVERYATETKTDHGHEVPKNSAP